MAYPLTKCEMEFYESARHSLASISKSLETLTDDIVKTKLINKLQKKLLEVTDSYHSWIGTGAMENEDQAMWLGKIKMLEELIKEINGKE